MKYKNIFNKLSNIAKNTPIIVEWFDASTTTHAQINGLPLPNYYVETRRRTTGSFICLQKGKFVDEWHLIIELDHTEEVGTNIRSIPLCLIYNIITTDKV